MPVTDLLTLVQKNDQLNKISDACLGNQVLQLLYAYDKCKEKEIDLEKIDGGFEHFVLRDVFGYTWFSLNTNTDTLQTNMFKKFDEIYNYLKKISQSSTLPISLAIEPKYGGSGPAMSFVKFIDDEAYPKIVLYNTQTNSGIEETFLLKDLIYTYNITITSIKPFSQNN